MIENSLNYFEFPFDSPAFCSETATVDVYVSKLY